MPRSAIMITKSLRLSLKLVYQLTQRMMICPSKCRPLNSTSTGTDGCILSSSPIATCLHQNLNLHLGTPNALNWVGYGGNMLKKVSTVACVLVLLTTASQAADQVLKGDAAFGDWRDDKPGVKRLLTAQDLPPVSSPTYAAAAIAPMPAGA